MRDDPNGRPPCWQPGAPCPNPCAAAHHDRTVHGTTSLHGAWTGWRIAGPHLISPDRHRVTPAVLAHLLHLASLHAWHETHGLASQARQARTRRAERRQQLVRVVVVDLATWKRERGHSAA